MNAQDLLNFLRKLVNSGISLRHVDVNFRQDFDSDVVKVVGVCADLYDAETNSRLTSIVLYADGRNI